jgi:hypothetical protein
VYNIREEGKAVSMKNVCINRIVCMIVCFALGIFVISSFSMTQEMSDEELKEMYAPILGEYEFVVGGEVSIIRFYIEENDLWADSGDGRPAILEPVEDEKFSFTAEDPISGLFEIKFIKDDQGEYTTCHLVSTSMGLDIKGTKIGLG